MTADLITIGKVLGIPGAMILVWYLLEKARGERAADLEKQKIAAAAKADEQRVAAENRKTEAMEAGFRSLGQLIADHAKADISSHGKQNERLAVIESKLGIRNTPAQGVAVIGRARSQGER